MQGVQSNFYLFPKHFFPAFLVWGRLNKLIQRGDKNTSKDCQQGFWVIFTFGRHKRACLLVRFVRWLRPSAGLNVWARGQLTVSIFLMYQHDRQLCWSTVKPQPRTLLNRDGAVRCHLHYVSLLAPILHPKLFPFLVSLSLITSHPI